MFVSCFHRVGKVSGSIGWTAGPGHGYGTDLIFKQKSWPLLSEEPPAYPSSHTQHEADALME